MYEEIGENIVVGAIFKSSSIVPRWFIWNRKKYTVKKTTYIWKNNNGEEKIYNFDVTDGANVFELSYNAKTANWVLNKVYVEG